MNLPLNLRKSAVVIPYGDLPLFERIDYRAVREVMKMRSEFCSPIAVILENQGKEQLSQLIVELAREDREFQRAILNVVLSSLNIVTKM